MTFWQCASSGRGDRHDPRRGRAAAEARRYYCRPIELLAGLAATEHEVPHDKDPRTAAVRTIHSSKFSTENSLRPDLFTPVDVAGAQCDSRVVGSLWPPPLWRSLPLFWIKKFNSQEMDGRTLAKTASTGTASRLERRSGGVSLTTREELRGDRPPARRVDMKAIRRSQNLALSSMVFWPG